MARARWSSIRRASNGQPSAARPNARPTPHTPYPAPAPPPVRVKARLTGQPVHRALDHQPGPLAMDARRRCRLALVFESLLGLGKNGVIVLTSVTGGGRTLEVPADKIDLEFVLGNRVMVGSVNASRENVETGVRDMSQRPSTPTPAGCAGSSRTRSAAVAPGD
jgi:hypothetical protein